ncbi:MAG: glycosyltransferase [Nitrospira sp.]|nr:glycosyltransferase [Nitrospira sp.]
MKILFVVHDFFPKFFGGTERYVLNMAKQMQRMGNNVKVFTYGVADPPDAFSKQNAILHRTYVFEGIPVICIRHKEIPPDQGYRISDDMLEDVAAILKTEKPDVIHVAHPMRLSAVISAAKMIGIPVVLTITDFWLLCVRGRFFKPDYSLCNSPEDGQKCKLQCYVDDSIFERNNKAKQLFESVDMRIAPSRFLIEIFKANKWDNPIQHINHGVDYKYVAPSQRVKRPGEPIIFSYMGVVSRFKGIDLLIDSFKKVKSSNIRLHIYGNCVGDDGTIDLLREAETEDIRIRSMGQFNHDELPGILNQVDIVITPSTTLESYGLVVIESLAYSVPVIASNIVGSAYEFIQNGMNGMIFSINNPEELVENIKKISEQPYVIDMMKSNITPPPRLEEEVFIVQKIYKSLVQ